ncbi:hypothetical protein LOTGIDRAFT_181589 [Lottia gigantea]|uniref:Phosphoglycolate phosphatase n=1 Tax=Lottia gigantea TaxID=225164 RepID=V4A1B8_LOTGI|nr:hypothetical protein LOTGIDRAFT_181589 [Lottia gigantea]ESO97618.1 hypothetical protein LOTGIDRAFT_181589 [Lottia gigantea]
MSCERLTKEHAKKVMSETDHFLFDCDGVLWDGNGTIPGSVDTISNLKRLGKKVYYVTNNSSSSRDEYQLKCQKYGFDADMSDIVGTAFASALYLHTSNFKGKVYVVGNPGMGKELDNFNISHIGIGPDEVEQDNSVKYSDRVKSWLNTQLDPQVNCVLVGFDPFISYHKILKAASYIQRDNCLFLATNEDTHLPTQGSDIVIPGTGTMVLSVSHAARKKPLVIGKPETTMFDVLAKANDLQPSRCMMVGDRMNTDIKMARRCNLKSLLVFTGVCGIDDLPHNGLKAESFEGSDDSPDFYADCLGKFGEFISDL